MSLIPLYLSGSPPGLFDLGALVATPDAVTALQVAGVSARTLLTRHVRGDWGETDPEDAQLNDAALANGARLMSVYSLGDNMRVWIITEGDRSTTTILCPNEY